MNCFRVVYRFDPGLDRDQRNALIAAFTEHAIEENGLQCGGGGSANVWNVIVESGNLGIGDITERQRDAVIAWLRNEQLVLDFVVGDLVEGEPVEQSLLEDLDRLIQAIENKAPRLEIDQLFDQIAEHRPRGRRP